MKKKRALYEVHITVDSENVDDWKRMCESLGIKTLYIHLSQGKHPRQLMCAGSHYGTPRSVRAYVDKLKGDIEKEFRILRVKLECALGHARYLKAKPVYCECHIKLDIPPQELPDFFSHAKRMGLFASTNVLRETNSAQRWYLTTRLYGCTVQDAHSAFNKAIRAARQNLSVRAADMEAVLYDTFQGLDDDWIIK